MYITDLELRCFRNYTHLQLEFDKNINVFIGSNAQGKTNILEAIYACSTGHSHRTSSDDDMIQWNEEQSMVGISYIKRETKNNIQYGLHRTKKRKMILNEIQLKNKEFLGNVTIVLFSPEDLWMIKGSPALRRKFLDGEIAQTSPIYYQQSVEYNRIVMQRNYLLKKVRENKRKEDLLFPWDEQLAVIAGQIYRKRLESIKKINMLANLMHRKITNSQENLSVRYIVYDGENHQSESYMEGVGTKEWYLQKLTEKREDDVRRGITNIGPHRDDISFIVNGHNLKSFGSQGQQRTGVLALKLAELEYIKSETGEYPVLLLDDVMSELDGNRRDQLLYFINNRIQTFITATDKSLFPSNRESRYYHVNEGNISE